MYLLNSKRSPPIELKLTISTNILSNWNEGHIFEKKKLNFRPIKQNILIEQHIPYKNGKGERGGEINKLKSVGNKDWLRKQSLWWSSDGDRRFGNLWKKHIKNFLFWRWRRGKERERLKLFSPIKLKCGMKRGVMGNGVEKLWMWYRRERWRSNNRDILSSWMKKNRGRCNDIKQREEGVWVSGYGIRVSVETHLLGLTVSSTEENNNVE